MFANIFLCHHSFIVYIIVNLRILFLILFSFLLYLTSILLSLFVFFRRFIIFFLEYLNAFYNDLFAIALNLILNKEYTYIEFVYKLKNSYAIENLIYLLINSGVQIYIHNYIISYQRFV